MFKIFLLLALISLVTTCAAVIVLFYYFDKKQAETRVVRLTKNEYFLKFAQPRNFRNYGKIQKTHRIAKRQNRPSARLC